MIVYSITLWYIHIDPGRHRGWKTHFHSNLVMFRVYVHSDPIQPPFSHGFPFKSHSTIHFPSVFPWFSHGSYGSAKSRAGPVELRGAGSRCPPFFCPVAVQEFSHFYIWLVDKYMVNGHIYGYLTDQMVGGLWYLEKGHIWINI